MDDMGSVYIKGVFEGIADFYPELTGLMHIKSGVYSYSVGGVESIIAFGPDSFISKYGEDGKFKWVKVLPGGGYFENMGLTIDGSGNLYVAGPFGVQNYFSQRINVSDELLEYERVFLIKYPQNTNPN